MTAPIRKTVAEMTGQPCRTCPWSALRDPFVHRVLAAMTFFESGQLAFALPAPSHRLVSGISFYHSTSNRMFAKQQELADQQRAREQQQPAPSSKGRRRG